MSLQEFENIINLFNSPEASNIELGLQICKGLKWSFASDLTIEDVRILGASSKNTYYIGKVGHHSLYHAFLRKMKFGTVSPKEWSYYKMYSAYFGKGLSYYPASFSLPNDSAIFDNFVKNFLYGVMFGVDSIHVRFAYSLYKGYEFAYKTPLDCALKTLSVPSLLSLVPTEFRAFDAILNRATLSKINA